MARKSQRISSGSAATPQHKRAGSNTLPVALAAKRVKSTPTKSEYFKDQYGPPEADESGIEEPPTSSDDDGASDFGDQDPHPTSEEEVEDDSYDSDSDEAPKKRSRGAKAKATTNSTATNTKGNELWRSVP